MLHSNLRTLNADRRGAVAIMVSIMAAVLITCASLGVEVVLALRTQSAMQTAADSTALAAAVAGVMGYPTESEQGTAVALAAGFGGSNWNTPPDCLSTSAATLPFIYVGTPCDGPHQGDRNYVEAFLEMNFPLRLARVLFGGDFVVHGRAVATVQSSEVCMVVSNPSTATAPPVARPSRSTAARRSRSTAAKLMSTRIR